MTHDERSLITRLLTQYRQEHDIEDTAERPFPREDTKVVLTEDQCAAIDDMAEFNHEGSQ